MIIRFTKLQALGNDFLVLGPDETFPAGLAPELARRVCARHAGVGADGIIVLNRRENRPARWGFRIFNADGSEAELSGNGLRTAMGFLRLHGLTNSNLETFATAAGDRICEVTKAAGRAFEMLVSMDEPRFAPADIPFDDGTARDRVVDLPILAGGREWSATCVSVGNPHCSLFVDRMPSQGERDLAGAEIERHRFFPERTNVEFVRVLDRGGIEVRFWERGVGVSLASGTGSAAAAAAAMVKGLIDRTVTVRTAMGAMLVEWTPGSGIRQTGPVEAVFEGTYDFV